MKVLCVITAAVFLSAGTAIAQSNQNQNPNPNRHERAEENAQERASGINDRVDIVNGPTVENLTPNSASLAWTTNNVAATRVRYGTDAANPSQHAYEAGGTRDHRVQLNNLRPGTTYHYEIETRGGRDRYKGSFHTPRG